MRSEGIHQFKDMRKFSHTREASSNLVLREERVEGTRDNFLCQTDRQPVSQAGLERSSSILKDLIARIELPASEFPGSDRWRVAKACLMLVQR